MDQGSVSFAGLTIVGGEMTHVRGVRPSRCYLIVHPFGSFTQLNGTLTFSFGLDSVSFPNAAMVSNSAQVVTDERHGWAWHIQVEDRRWKWRYPRIDGMYNKRSPDGTVQAAYKKNAKELAEILLDALGETGYDTSAISEDVFPPVFWRRARAALELEWLCDLLGMVVCLKIDNTVAIRPLNASGTLPIAIELSPSEYGWTDAVRPKKLQVKPDPTIFQDKFPLVPVGLDTTGEIKPIDDLSYKPTNGWERQWPFGFPEVGPDERHLAFKTVWRWYRPDEDLLPEGENVTLNKVHQIEFLDHLVEGVKDIIEDVGDHFYETNPVIKGVYWPYEDLNKNTIEDRIYQGNVRLLHELNVVEFEHPVFKYEEGPSQGDGTDVKPADIDLIAAYRVREEDGSGWDTHTKEKNVTNGQSGTRVLQHPELTKVVIRENIYGESTGNETEIEAEMDVYLDEVEKTYQFTNAKDVVFNGIVSSTGLDGTISQIKYRAGLGRPTYTRMGLFTEFDLNTMHHQQRRALNRLAQMAERQML